MLSPEIWNFKEPDSTFKIQQTDTDQNLFCKKINNFYYNHLVTVIVPDTLKVPEYLTDILNIDCEYYKIKEVNLSELINREFITSFVRSGRLTALSIDSRIDCDNSVAITPKGQLILNLNKDTYQCLGLEGQVSFFESKQRSRYIIRIDLTEDHLQKNTPKHERTKSCLQKLEKFNIIFSWDPPTEDVCPSSPAKYFSSLGYQVNLCQPQYDSRTSYSIKVPEVNFDSFDEGSCHDFIEWLGMVSLNADFELGGTTSYLSAYETPEPNSLTGQVKCLTWSGLFTCSKLEELVLQIEKLQNSEEKPWVAMYVQGFSDSPVAWGNNEHHYYTNGDNGYLFIMNNKRSLICSQMCSTKRYK